jgi:two-component system alkaline phosphatase synthesis response regulator PhoP
MQPNAVTKGAGSVLSVLVVSADRSLGTTAKQSLGNGGVQITVIADVDQAITELQEGDLSLAIVDYEIAGAQCEELVARAESANGVPLIVVVSRDAEIPQCLALGASDFISKPVSPQELAGRAAIHGVGESRRAGMRALGDGLVIDTSARRVTIDGETVDLASREYELLEFLASRPGVTFTREELLASVWRSSSEWQGTSTVTEHVHRLRQKLEPDPDRPRWIVTVHGHGYRLEP